MSYIVPGKCRQCGCNGYQKDVEGDNCYTCGHVRDLHILQYKPSSQCSSVSGAAACSLTLPEATVDIPPEQSLTEKFPQGAPGICFEETVAVVTAGSKPGASVVQLSRKTPMKSKTQALNSNGSKELESPIMATMTPSESASKILKRFAESPKVKSSPGKVLATKKRRSSDIFESPAPYTGQKTACWRLRMSHLPYGMEPPDGIKGTYKIAERGQTIYVGNATKVPIVNTLRSHFRGKDKQIIGAYLSSLAEDEREKDITLFWLDETEVKHTCQTSFLKCFERMEGKKPQYNMAGKRLQGDKSKAELDVQPPLSECPLDEKCVE